MKNLFKIVLSFALAVVIGLSIINFVPGVNAETVEAVDGSDPYAILCTLDEVSGAKDVRSEYRLENSLDVAYGTVHKFLQLSGEYEVYGSDLAVSVNKEGKVLSVEGQYIRIPELTENLTEADAIGILNESYGDCAVLSTKKLIFASDRAPELAYEFVITANGGTRCFVSAVSGEIMYSTPISAQPVVTQMTQVDAYGNEIELDVEYNPNFDVYSLVDETRNIYTYDANNSTDNLYPDYMDYVEVEGADGVLDPIAVTAYSNMIKAYDFYTDANNIGVSLHGVDGLNDDVAYNRTRNKEVRIVIFVHYDRGLDNAFCQYKVSGDDKIAFICIGDGSGYQLKDPAKSLDILGHEYQHAVTSVTAKLNYSGESGALNEAFSDILGALIEDKEGTAFWEIGEDSGVRIGRDENNNWVQIPAALRSMAGGTSGQRYDAANKYVCTRHSDDSQHTSSECDDNGVHYNSTIISHVQYKICQAMPEYFTNDRIGQLWYATLCTLDETSDFDDFAIAFLRAAKNLNFTEGALSVIRESLESSHLLPEHAFHNVTFVDYDDTVIATYEVLDGETIPYTDRPADPVREGDAQYTYRFRGWDKPITNITSDITFKAEYNVFVNEYLVTIMGVIPGEKVYEEYFEYGQEFDLEQVGDLPEQGENWTFAGFFADSEYTTPMENFTVTGDVTFFARWDYNPPAPPPEEEEPTKSNCATVASIVGGNGQGGGGLMVGLAALISACLLVVLTKKKAEQK